MVCNNFYDDIKFWQLRIHEKHKKSSRIEGYGMANDSFFPVEDMLKPMSKHEKGRALGHED